MYFNLSVLVNQLLTKFLDYSLCKMKIMISPVSILYKTTVKDVELQIWVFIGLMSFWRKYETTFYFCSALVSPAWHLLLTLSSEMCSFLGRSLRLRSVALKWTGTLPWLRWRYGSQCWSHDQGSGQVVTGEMSGRWKEAKASPEQVVLGSSR